MAAVRYLGSMRHGQDVLASPDAVHDTEWLLSNGLGGSASGTASGAATRRTHALLTAATEHGRLVTLLLGFDERLLDEASSWDLTPVTPAVRASAVPAAAAAGPRSAARAVIDAFSSNPTPTWRIRAGEIVIEKRVRMIRGHHAVMVSWRHLSGPQARLTLGPCVTCRAPDQLARSLADAPGAAQGVPGRVRVELKPGEPALTLWHNGTFLPARVWQRELRYPLDPDGGTASEDALVPGWVEAALKPGQPLIVVASAEDDLFRKLASEERLGTPPPRSLAECAAVLEQEAAAHENAERRRIVAGADFTARQAAAAHNSPLARRRDALVDGGDRWTVALGEAVVAAQVSHAHHARLVESLPVPNPHAGCGVRAIAALVTLRRFEDARDLLGSAVEYLDEGFAPESFDAHDGTPRYGDPEPALRLVAAADVYARRSEDLDYVRERLYPALEGVMQFYRAGSRGVRVGEHGLLEIVRGAHAIAPADLNALWYHALVAMAQMAKLVGRRENGAYYLAWARELQQCFGERLWDESRGRLFGRLEDGRAIAELAPAHVLAASLTPALISPDRARRLVEAIERDLFTPFGLREKPRSGVVLSSWLGPFYSAYVRAHGRDAGALSRVHDWLEMLRDELGRERIPGVPATFTVADGQAPRSCGAFSTAAAGELLRAWIEDLDPCAAPAHAERRALLQV
jgi:hypothetical protein